jgi:hypothetical protein
VVTPLIQQFCVDCHGSKKTKGDINLEEILKESSVAENFKNWELVVDMLQFQDMPPEEEKQPSDQERNSLITTISSILQDAIQKNAGEPGKIALRRLTSAEYAYTIEDLTGLNLHLEKSFVGEAVGGEGFSNVGEVQFMQDATLERYLEAAKTVASHAVIGAGPLRFYENPGKTGQELSAINRIKDIYLLNGFRTGAGEGAKAYGLDQYAKAFYATWKYKHRDALGEWSSTMDDLAEAEAISPTFLKHIWQVLTQASPSFPTDQIVTQWKELPIPSKEFATDETSIRSACEKLYDNLFNWQRTLAASTQDDEEYAVLTTQPFEPHASYPFRIRMNQPGDNSILEFNIFVKAASGKENAQPAVLWKEPRIRARSAGDKDWTNYPLREIATAETSEQLQFGSGFKNTAVDPNDFVTHGTQHLSIRVKVPSAGARMEFLVEPIIDIANGEDCLVRCEITDGSNARETISSTGNASALIASPNSPRVDEWESGILNFAQNLPQVSQREPTPSDRDWIPQPFDNTYNEPERNYFHTAIKYHRDDAFLTNKILDEAHAQQLNDAWTDLLTAFDYHDTIYQFVVNKYGLQNQPKSIEELDAPWITRQAPEPRGHLERLLSDYEQKQIALKAAEPAQIEEVLQFAEKAWRRPLPDFDTSRLRSYYQQLRKDRGLDHDAALRTLLVRILVAPEFLYRIESPKGTDAIVPLPDYALASRLSYFLWSSPPDDELLEAAANGQLKNDETLIRQTRRMLKDPKARRFATEFFGQWFGFYRFDDYSGIDTKRFTGFTDELKAAMYDEAVSFFEYIVTQDRPADDILFADYTFLNKDLAGHYGIPWEAETNDMVHIEGTHQFNRGGLLQMGAVHTVTSAPLRTSAVKRGDWVLRRVLGTPTPPPPANAGSIPADDVMPDGLSVRERLEAHRRDSSCINCHTRIDPLGFALENFDPVGQWRETYRDGSNIDTGGTLNDGTEITDLEDLYDYLQQEEATVHRNLCRKLLGYALGRAEIISDRLLIDKMVQSLEADNRFSNLITQVVTSPQFRNQRGRQLESAANENTSSGKVNDSEI